MDLKIGTIIETKKAHPCGGKTWEVIRLGIDVKIKCTSCNHVVMIPRLQLNKKIKKIVK